MDARKAHLKPLVEGDVYIQLPEEAGAAAGMCGKLVHWIYGMRPTAQAWESLYAGKMEGAGFKRGKGSAVMFYHEGRDISGLVHGDDFVFVGDDEDFDWIQGEMVGWFDTGQGKDR